MKSIFFNTSNNTTKPSCAKIIKKSILMIPVFFLFFIFSPTIIPKATAQFSVSFQIFYDEMSPYGSWINNNTYGYVWVPNNRQNFFPYSSNGYWLYTDLGWTWYSDYPWGWATFHYGRWFFDSFYGWVWVPGYEWAPAWVTWRQTNDYYGWAPIGPDISTSMAFTNGYYLPYDRWRFINRKNLGRKDMNHHFEGLAGYLNYLNQSNIISNVHYDEPRNIHYHAGPDRKEVEKITGKAIVPFEIKPIKSATNIVDKHQLLIFKPEVIAKDPHEIQPAPQKAQQWKGTIIKKEEVPSEKPNPVNPAQDQISPQRNIEIISPEKNNPPLQPDNPAPRKLEQQPKILVPEREEPIRKQATIEKSDREINVTPSPKNESRRMEQQPKILVPEREEPIRKQAPIQKSENPPPKQRIKKEPQ